jgi:ABC-type dipeptide/oligopeptide/nickel transport system permease subunit
VSLAEQDAAPRVVPRRQPAPRSLWIGLALSAVFVAAAALSFVWTPYAVDGMNIPARLQPPTWAHPLGTDHFGRDILSMIMVGARTSIAVALLAVGIGMALGVPLGLAAAARKEGLLDEVIMRANDLIFAFPSSTSPSSRGSRGARRSAFGSGSSSSPPASPASPPPASAPSTSCPTSPTC